MRSAAPSLTNRLRRGFGRAALLVVAVAGAASAPAMAADQAPSNGAPIGDFNGDGFGDFVAKQGAWPYTTVVAFGSAGAGVVQLPGEGGTGLTLGLENTPERLEQPGTFMPLPARIGDFDHDGYADVAQVGDINRSWIVYGAPGTADVDVATPGPRVTTLIHDYHYLDEQRLYGIGDFNGDGFSDELQSRYSSPNSGGTAALPKVGGAVIILGGPRVAELETRGSGGRRIQVDTNAKCATRWVVIIPSYTCEWIWPNLEPIGDYDADGKADLYQSTGSFVIRGRSSTATFNGMRTDANTIVVPIKPQGSPWAPPVVVPPPVDPGSTGTDGWALSGVARRTTDGAVLLASGDSSNTSGAIYDDRKTVDANAIVVDFDLQLVNRSGNGNGVTLAFASPSQGGVPRAANYGIGLGWVTNRGTAITFGTVKGTYTPSNNYVGIASGVAAKSGYPTFLQTAPAVSPLADATNHVTVKASGGVVTVSINGTERLRRTMTLPADAYVGFTAGTSAARQDHIVKNVVIAKP